MDMREMWDLSDDLLPMDRLTIAIPSSPMGFPPKSITIWFNFTSWHLSSVMFWWQTELVWNINSNAINMYWIQKPKEDNQLVSNWVTFDFYSNTGIFIVQLTFSSCIPQTAFLSSSSFLLRQKWWFWNKFFICIFKTCVSSLRKDNFLYNNKMSFWFCLKLSENDNFDGRNWL